MHLIFNLTILCMCEGLFRDNKLYYCVRNIGNTYKNDPPLKKKKWGLHSVPLPNKMRPKIQWSMLPMQIDNDGPAKNLSNSILKKNAVKSMLPWSRQKNTFQYKNSKASKALGTSNPLHPHRSALTWSSISCQKQSISSTSAAMS